LAGSDSERQRHKKFLENGTWKTKSFTKKVPRTKLVEEMFKAFSKVDIHDHLRQGSLGLERTWITRRWYMRLFATVFGICVVDAYYALRYEQSLTVMDFTEFWSVLAHQLIKNNLVATGSATRSQHDDAEVNEVFLELFSILFDATDLSSYSFSHINSLELCVTP
jgi:hypothetical protein